MVNLKMWRRWTSCAVRLIDHIFTNFAYAGLQLSVISTDQRHLGGNVMQVCYAQASAVWVTGAAAAA